MNYHETIAALMGIGHSAQSAYNLVEKRRQHNQLEASNEILEEYTGTETQRRNFMSEETESYIRGLEHDNAALEARTEKKMLKIKTLRTANIELKEALNKCRALWRVRV